MKKEKTMKKSYISPATEALEYVMEEMIATSSVTSDNGLDYGGIDEDGDLEAETRMLIDDFIFD